MSAATSGEDSLLEVRDLAVSFTSPEGEVIALDGISFDIPRRGTVALVGESGSGKSVTAHAIMRLLPSPPARITSGSIRLDGQDLLTLPERQMRRLRGARIGLVFQDPQSALNPVYSVGSQVAEALRIHGRTIPSNPTGLAKLFQPLRRLLALFRLEGRREAIELLRRVGFPQPDERFDDFPHQLSGGMRQRVMVAIALSCSPELIIADEPTTALDMLAAAQINALLADLKRHHDLSMLLISHDLASVAEIADQIVVLYAGQIMERGPARELLTNPKHPYTRGLLGSIPPLRKRRRRRRPTPTRLPTIAGGIPDPSQRPRGCRFADRCGEVMDRCRASVPPMVRVGDSEVRCLLHVADGAPAADEGAA